MINIAEDAKKNEEVTTSVTKSEGPEQIIIDVDGSWHKIEKGEDGYHKCHYAPDEPCCCDEEECCYDFEGEYEPNNDHITAWVIPANQIVKIENRMSDIREVANDDPIGLLKAVYDLMGTLDTILWDERNIATFPPKENENE